jgi:hypothetical protein
MTRHTQSEQPAQVPGDAESPAKGKTDRKSDRTIEQAIRHSDKTEPVQSERKDSAKRPG